MSSYVKVDSPATTWLLFPLVAVLLGIARSAGVSLGRVYVKKRAIFHSTDNVQFGDGVNGVGGGGKNLYIDLPTPSTLLL